MELIHESITVWCNVCQRTNSIVARMTDRYDSTYICAACLVKALALFPTEEIMRLQIAQRARKEKDDGNKPCPFCAFDGPRMPIKGNEGYGSYWSVYCLACEAEGPSGQSPEKAAALWNDRIMRLPKDLIDKLCGEEKEDA